MQYTNLCWEPRTSDDKQSEFMYDKGWYSITDIVGEEKNIIYKSRNAGRHILSGISISAGKERLTPEERKKQREERYEKKREQNREYHRI